MSVFVKGINLPDACGDCQFCHTENFSSWCCINDRDDFFYEERADWCPLEDADEVCMKHYKQGRLDEAAEREGRLMQSFSPD